MPQMPKQAFGGDDSGSGSHQPPPEKPKKLDLSKYINKPDLNIRDLFWVIMEAYKKRQDVKEQLRNFYGQRMSILRIAITVATDKRGSQYPISQNSVATYMLKIIFDENWEDVFLEFLDSTYDRKRGIATPFIVGANGLYEDPNYASALVEVLRKNLREGTDIEPILAYLATMQSKKLSEELKKELLIIATQDIDENQHYAISALSELAEDADVRKPLIRLLGDWDEGTRKMIAEMMKNIKDPELLEEAKRQIPHEKNDYIQSLMKRIISNNS
ncbi:HEAT repeat domain-containing protein [Candidatus Micrarchaeota archaeon]|nr:HEAT repeat domain-containing protein [Candidatus Micrarchaeota archaeon]